MSESRKLQDILVVCVLRYGKTQDKCFALAALVAYQALPDVLRPAAIDYVEGKVREIKTGSFRPYRSIGPIIVVERSQRSFAQLGSRRPSRERGQRDFTATKPRRAYVKKRLNF